jgi:phospholipid/cholesterol/gamma-HCH transport system substrate-binding protein
MTLKRNVEVQEDAIAAVKTKGLIGEKYIQIMPGGSEEIIPPMGQIRETQSAVDLEQLISKFAFGKI